MAFNSGGFRMVEGEGGGGGGGVEGVRLPLNIWRIKKRRGVKGISEMIIPYFSEAS